MLTVERAFGLILYFLAGILIAVNLQGRSQIALAQGGVHPSVAYPVSLGILVIVLVLWVVVLRLILKRMS